MNVTLPRSRNRYGVLDYNAENHRSHDIGYLNNEILIDFAARVDRILKSRGYTEDNPAILVGRGGSGISLGIVCQLISPRCKFIPSHHIPSENSYFIVDDHIETGDTIATIIEEWIAEPIGVFTISECFMFKNIFNVEIIHVGTA